MGIRKMGHSSKLWSLMLTFLTLGIPSLMFGLGKLNFKPGLNFFSPQEDVKVGKQNAAEVDKQMPILHDAEVERYVNDLGRRLSAYTPNNLPDYAWQFKVVNTSDINAFALPGGFIYVNRGTIEAAEDEAQLAGVIAHEEGHVVMRHGTHQVSQMELAQAPLAILGAFGGRGGAMGQLGQLGLGLGINSIFLHNSRGMESQADEVGTYVLYRAGYDPHAMAQFFEIIAKKYPQRTLQLLSDHPSPGNRIKAVDAEIAQLGPERQWKTDSPEFQAIKKRLQSLPPPPKVNPQQQGAGGGGRRSDLTPSENFKTLSHSGFNINYPENWQVYGGESSGVTIAPQAGIVQNALAYGVIINDFEPERGRAGSLDGATHQLIDTLRQSNPNLRAIGNDEDISINGVPGKSLDMTGPSPIQQQGQPLREHDWLVTLARPDNTLLYLVFISPEDAVRQFRPTYEKMLQSVRLR